MTAKELRERAAEIAIEIQRLADLTTADGYEATAEDTENWEKANADYDALKRKVEIAERSETVKAAQEARAQGPTPGRDDYDGSTQRATDDDGAPTEEHRALALQAWCRHQMGDDLEERHIEACRRTGMRPGRRNLDIQLPDTSTVRDYQRVWRTHHPSRVNAQQRALSSITGSTGGLTIPEGFIANLEINMQAFGGIRQVAEIMRTDNGQDLPWPTADDTSNTGAILAENAVITYTDEPSFGAVVWHAYKYTSKAVLVPQELMEDSAFDLPGVLGSMLGERLGRITNTHNTTGTGDAMPNGIVTASTLGKTCASETVIAENEIMDLIHSLDPAYRSGPDVGFMMHDLIVLALRKLRDGEGRTVWQSGMRDGVPDVIYGYPLTVNQDMASSIASAAKTMIFGPFKKYKVREVRNVRMYRLEERYRDNDRDGFVAFLRQDGNLLDAGAGVIRHMVQA